MRLAVPKTRREMIESRYRRVRVARIEARGEKMVRVWFAGDDLHDFVSPNSGDHVKLQVPGADGELLQPVFDADGRLANMRDLQMRDMTPRIVGDCEVALDIVRHSGGVIGDWLVRAKVGDECAFVGPKATKYIEEELDRFIAVIDLSALPAAERRFAVLGVPGEIYLIGGEGVTPDVPGNVAVTVCPDNAWEYAALQVARECDGGDRLYIWGAGEALGAATVRRHVREKARDGLFAMFNGYWQQGVSEYDHHAELPV